MKKLKEKICGVIRCFNQLIKMVLNLQIVLLQVIPVVFSIWMSDGGINMQDLELQPPLTYYASTNQHPDPSQEI